MDAELILNIEQDDFQDGPNEWGGWKVITFDQRMTTDEPSFLYRLNEPEVVGEQPVPADAEFGKLIRRKLAFWLERSSGEDFQLWGGGVFARNVCGVVVWDGETSPVCKGSRKDDASSFLKTFNQWRNGDVWMWSLETAEGVHLDGCGGCYDVKAMQNELSALLVKPWAVKTEFPFLLDGLSSAAERLQVKEPTYA